MVASWNVSFLQSVDSTSQPEDCFMVTPQSSTLLLLMRFVVAGGDPCTKVCKAWYILFHIFGPLCLFYGL
ncbi:hypothetical protein L6452_21309 [Arctium lappa]|uniref:Uncharacterized protein n=1 Tax=Arctium lappa TaxID=4217 RepID=A0ACB9BFQ8_ARCLA|nr:hypothetical protein L6452_21309 [Arctium lappa]